MSRNGSRTISEHIVKRVVAALDATAILAAGIAAMHWHAMGVDWRLAGLVVLLGTILGVNFLHLAGAYRFGSYARFDGAIGRVLRCSSPPACSNR
jgi:fatty acid desaturase